MKKISLRELLEAGAHFGHQVNRWHPKAKEYIYTERDKIHIIDLAKTKIAMEEAAEFVKNSASNGGKIIFLGTKHQAKKILTEEAKKAGAMFLVKRWLGGLFTNWEQMEKNLIKIKELERKLNSDEEKAKFTKYEVGLWQKEHDKLMDLYGGIYDLARIPEMMFIVDLKREKAAVAEAINKGVAVIAIADTNTDPTQVEHPIPANDDAVGSIRLITSYIADAYKEGTEIYNKKKADQEKKEIKKDKKINN
jgi:small subunit ribosomal protein S2